MWTRYYHSLYDRYGMVITGVDFVTAKEPKKVSSEEEVVVEKVKIYNEPKI